MNTTMTKYPVGVMTQQVSVPDAKVYYTALQAKPNRVGYTHTSPAWLVAVNEERRKEFNSEWCLCPDMVRSGYIEDHINYNYPRMMAVVITLTILGPSVHSTSISRRWICQSQLMRS